MKRILILGISGSGKTTLARRLHNVSRYPTHHLDVYFWQPGWKFPDSEKWQAKVREISNSKTWIIEGNYQSALSILVPRADAIVLLHTSCWIALSRVIRRTVLHLGQDRADRARGCTEKLDWDFVKYILRFDTDRKPLIIEAIETLRAKALVFNLSRPQELEDFCEKFSVLPQV